MHFLKALDDPVRRELLTGRLHNDECKQNLPRAYMAISKLLARPWFRRTWIRHALAAGRKVMVQCGNITIGWNAFKRSSLRATNIRKQLQDNGEYPSLPEIQIGTMEYLTRSWTYGKTVLGCVSIPGSFYYFHGGGLLELLLISGDFEATDPRDRVYAVLGLAREPIEGGDDEEALFPFVDEGEVFEPLRIDYNSSVSEVYQRLAKHVINRDLNLDILCLVGSLRNAGSTDLPSWTPDWRVPWDSAACGTGRSLFDYLHLKFLAASYTRAEKQDQLEIGKLHVKAYMVDEVARLLDVTTGALELMYENGEAIIKSNGEMPNETEWRKLKVFWDYQEGKSSKRCCMTREGHVALVPPATRVGDRIFVLLGARLPFVLRAAVNDGKRYEVEGEESNLGSDSEEMIIVGPSCLPGFMLGEVFPAVGDMEAVDLTLI